MLKNNVPDWIEKKPTFHMPSVPRIDLMRHREKRFTADLDDPQTRAMASSLLPASFVSIGACNPLVSLPDTFVMPDYDDLCPSF